MGKKPYPLDAPTKVSKAMSGVYQDSVSSREQLHQALLASAEPHGITKLQKMILEAISAVAGMERTDAGFIFNLQDICDYMDGLPPLTIGFELGQFVGRSNGFGDVFGRLDDGSWGVQVCATSRSFRNCFVYVMDNGFHRKVGISNNPDKRRNALYTASSLPIEVVYRVRCARPECIDIEKRVHRAHSSQRVNGEWFTTPAHHLIQSIRHARDWKTWYDDEHFSAVNQMSEAAL